MDPRDKTKASESRAERQKAGHWEQSVGGHLLPDDEPRRSPETDPTNPYRQEAMGIFALAARANERRIDEPGLTDKDRDQRAI